MVVFLAVGALVNSGRLDGGFSFLKRVVEIFSSYKLTIGAIVVALAFVKSCDVRSAFSLLRAVRRNRKFLQIVYGLLLQE